MWKCEPVMHVFQNQFDSQYIITTLASQNVYMIKLMLHENNWHGIRLECGNII